MLAVLLSAAELVASPAFAQQTQYHVLRAVPVSGKVTIDGTLDDREFPDGILMARGGIEPSPSATLPNLTERLQQTRYATSGPVAIEYVLPANGYATLVIETPDGQRVRNLISDYPREKGRNVDHWDGTDDQGRLVAPGEYRVRGLFHEGLDVKYEFAFGNPAPMPWPTAKGDGGWLSNHTNHMAVLADGERIYVSAPHTEGPFSLIAMNYEGQQVWGGLARWHAGFMARSGDYLYTVNDRGVGLPRREFDLNKSSPIELIRLDPGTGREVPFPDGSSRHTIAEWNIQKQGAAKKWEGWTVEHAAHDADWAATNPQGLAALDGTLYVALRFDQKLLKVDAGSGKVTGEIPLDKPAGLVSDGRRLLAVSGTRVVQVDPETGHTTPVISDRLKAPIDLALDSRGNIYVSDWADQMNVKVFSPAGRYIRRIGKSGGRPWVGQYDPQGMLLPRGISIDAQDRLWVAEADFSPRRVSCWNTDTGELVLERPGRGRYGGMGYYVLPDKPEQAILLNNLLDLDWEGGRWRVASTLWRGTRADEVIGLDPYTRLGRVIHRDGRRLVVHTSLQPQYGPVIISELTEDGQARPLAAVGRSGIWPHIRQRWQGGFAPEPVFADHLWTEPALNAAAKQVVPWVFEGPRAGEFRAVSHAAGKIHRQARQTGWRPNGRPRQLRPNANFVWSDLDGDGAVGKQEITYHATPKLEGPLPETWSPEQWSGGVAGDDLTLYLTAIQDGKAHHFRLPVNRWTEQGAPVYDPEQAELIVATPYMGESAWLSDDSHLLTLANRDGNFDRRDPLTMFRPDGSIAWTYPSPWTGVHGSHTAPQEKRGQLVGPLGVFGEAKFEGIGQIFALHTNVGTTEILTADGLYLGRLFRDSRSAPDPWPDQLRRGMSIMNTSNGGEWFGGQFFQDPDGQVYVVASKSAGVIARVTGLETTRRLREQSIVLTTEQYQQARQQQLAEAQKQVKQVQAMRVAPMKEAADPPALDAFRWDDEYSASWRYDETRTARATWRYDDKHLYVAFQVDDDTPMINSGEDVRQLFKFGDAAILELRTNPNEQSQQAIEGDQRLLFSVYKNKPVAVLYDYRQPGAKNPVEFEAVTTTRIDRVKVLGDAEIAIDRSAESYTLRAAIPLKDLSWRPDPGETYPGDFGIVYSDRAGTSNELRMHWSNQATGIVDDLSLEADIQPGNWGRFKVTE